MARSLFEPASLAGMELRNRFVRSATAEAMAEDQGRPTRQLAELYTSLAEGGVGLIITSGANIEPWANLPASIGVKAPLSIYDDDFIGPWEPIVEAVHEAGAKIAMQIGHLGRQDVGPLRGSAPLAPSPVPIEATGVTPVEMTKAQIEDVVEKFAQASRRVKEAGFDAVQFHGAHGNLITNFMSPFTNRRSDEYGGGVANRARFVVEMIRRSRQEVGPGYPLLIKLSASDFVEGGLDIGDCAEMAVMMAEAGIDAIEVSGGTLSESPQYISQAKILTKDKEAYFRPFAEAIKESAVVPVILVGGLRTPEVMDTILQDGAADFMALCRPLIREPDLINRWAAGDTSKATCVSCNQCFANWVHHPIRCFADHPLD